jgi:hypothetical protein
MEHTPLESLSPAVEKVAGRAAPEPARLMAARGMAPLGPADLAVALYQLAASNPPGTPIHDSAVATAAKMPDKIAQGAIEAVSTDARVVDFYAHRWVGRAQAIELVLQAASTSDETVHYLASVCEEAQLELIAKNEHRLLRAPQIIAALYLNKKTRMSTAQRAVELAVRNNVVVEGISSFEELKQAIELSGAQPPAPAPSEDAVFKEVAEQAAAERAAQPIEPEPEAAEAAAPAEKRKDETQLKDLSTAAKIRAATLGNAFVRSVLIRERNKQVAMACIKSPAVSDTEVVKYAANRALDDEIIRYISEQRSWVRNYQVKVALVNNPKCPVKASMKIMESLQIRDLKNLASSKGIPTALANAAKGLLQKKQ